MSKTLIALGVTGGIAAYKSAQLCSDLVKNGFEVQVIMTENATRFVHTKRRELRKGWERRVTRG